MYTYQIIIEYDGSNYVGWQIQKNGISVQEVIEKKIKKLLKKKITVYGSGRTDAGVHAIGQSAHFRLEKEIKDKFEFLKSLNFFYPKVIFQYYQFTNVRIHFTQDFLQKKDLQLFYN